jgi:leader peptidase (prepilin peptidase)/N-methyltransferase
MTALLVFAIGACIGSFVNLLAYRLPREIPITAPCSLCPKGRCTIPLWANVPIIAYLGLRRRCATCGSTIPLRYFLTEIVLGTIATYLYFAFAPPDAFARFVLCAALFTAALIDYDWRVIPNLITFAGIPLGLLAAWLMIPEVGLRDSLIGIAIGAGFLYVTGKIYMLVRGAEGIGMGDVWLIGMTGAFLGWRGALFTLFGGAILGTLGAIALTVGDGAKPPEEQVPEAVANVTGSDTSTAAPSWLQTTIPFGPFLALAATIFALFQPQLAHWYFSH